MFFPPSRDNGLGPIAATLIVVVGVIAILLIIWFRFGAATTTHG